MDMKLIILNIIPSILVAIIVGAFNFFKRGDKALALLDHKVLTLESKLKDQDEFIKTRLRVVEESFYKDSQRLASVEEEIKHLSIQVQNLMDVTKDQFKALQAISETLTKITTELTFIKRN